MAEEEKNEGADELGALLRDLLREEGLPKQIKRQTRLLLGRRVVKRNLVAGIEEVTVGASDYLQIEKPEQVDRQALGAKLTRAGGRFADAVLDYMDLSEAATLLEQLGRFEQAERLERMVDRRRAQDQGPRGD
jgi:hypothetical protein